MKTFEKKLHIHQGITGEGFFIAENDMTDHGYISLGSQTVTLNVPDTDPIEAEVMCLKKAIDKTKSECHAEVEVLSDRINSLLAIEYKESDNGK